MKTETIVMCIVALILGMLMANMLKDVCGCKTVEGNTPFQSCFSNEYSSSKQYDEAYCTCYKQYNPKISYCSLSSDVDGSGVHCNDVDKDFEQYCADTPFSHKSG